MVCGVCVLGVITGVVAMDGGNGGVVEGGSEWD